MNEEGFTICDKKGKLSRGPVRNGNSNSVRFPVSCPNGGKPRALYHTHPSGDLRPSNADIESSRKFNLPVCIGLPNGKKVKCYPPEK